MKENVKLHFVLGAFVGVGFLNGVLRSEVMWIPIFVAGVAVLCQIYWDDIRKFFKI